MAVLRHGRRAALIAGALVWSLGCRGEKDDRFASVEKKGPYDKVVAENIPAIEKATGLTFKRFPVVKATTAADMRAFAEKELTEEPTATQLRGQGAAYRALGLLPDTLDFSEFLLDLLEEQIVGLYDPATKVLYVRRDSLSEKNPAVTNLTIIHELIHALQDQYIDLDSIRTLLGDNDRAGALKSVIEGQSMYETIVTVGGASNVAARLRWDAVREQIRDQFTSTPMLAAAPMIVQETLIFPYLSGAEFAKRFKDKEPTKSLLQDLPSSTEQIIHAEAYFGKPRDEPVVITLPSLRKGAKVYENNLGEFETRLFLYQHLKDQEAAIRGAAGWDGDRYVLVRTPQGDGIAWVSVWDSAVDGGEFADLMERLIRKRYSASLPRVEGDTKHYVGGGRSLVITVREIGSRPAVIYVDMPTGASTDVLDLSAIRVR